MTRRIPAEEFRLPNGSLRQPCSECPFRKHAPAGWLGPWETEDFENMYTFDTDFICHTSIDTDQEHTCVGYVMVRVNSLKRAKDEQGHLGRLEKLYEELRGKNECFQWMHEFVEHHDGPTSLINQVKERES